MGSADSLQQQQKISTLRNQLGDSFEVSSLLASNPYCHIYKGSRDGEDCIIKQYAEGRQNLADREVEGITAYEKSVLGNTGFHSCRVMFQHQESGIFAMSFVPGSPLAHRLRSGMGTRERTEVLELMERLGSWLARFTALERKKGKPDVFLGEYLVYCSSKLEKSMWGGWLFPRMVAEAKELMKQYHRDDQVVGRIHGDFVPRNIHVDGTTLGVIDFANTLRESSPLNDLINFRMALENMGMSAKNTRSIYGALLSGFGCYECGIAELEFYGEYHRRRWLMLNLTSRQPWRVALGIRGLATFAKKGRVREWWP
jgi:hypothetical protein